MNEEVKALSDALNSKIEAIKTETVSKADYDALKLELEAVKTANADKSVTEDLQKKLDGLALEVKEIETKGTKGAAKSLEEQLTENKEALKEIANGSNKEVVVKALTLRSSITNNEQAFDLPDLGQLAHRKLTAYDIFPKLRVADGNNNGVIRYYDWDEDTIVRAAAAVAEGAVFPESTAKFKKGSISIQKIGDTLPVTEEFFEDAQMFAAELGMFLETNVAIKVDTDVINATGAGNTITGLVASVNAFTPVASGISDANIYDLLVKVSEAITLTGGSKYTPNFAVMNISDINKMKLKKDANENYMIPPFVSRDGSNVAGITVIECNAVTANTMVVGDNRFARIYEKAGIEISKGYSGTQFVEDEMTLKARKRLAFLIRSADKGGFLKVTSISAALVTLAT